MIRQISDSTREQTTKCPFSFQCLNDETRAVCTIDKCFKGNGCLIKTIKMYTCPYKMSFGYSDRSAFKAVLSGVGSLLFILFILLMWSAQIKSCFTTGGINNKSVLSNDIKIIKASPNKLKHRMIIKRLTNIYASLNLATQDKWTAYFINDKSSLNAASFGNGMYLFWETLADLPDWAIDSILAHEVAHDLLLHSRKMQDADDVRNFFTDVLSLLEGADNRTEKTLHEWSSKLTLPRYSQKQEYEADEFAVKILSISGHKKSELVFANTFKYIRNKYGDSGGGFFDYHPSTEERIKKVFSLKP